MLDIYVCFPQQTRIDCVLIQWLCRICLGARTKSTNGKIPDADFPTQRTLRLGRMKEHDQIGIGIKSTYRQPNLTQTNLTHKKLT
jgi:hypothetical protein